MRALNIPLLFVLTVGSIAQPRAKWLLIVPSVGLLDDGLEFQPWAGP